MRIPSILTRREGSTSILVAAALTAMLASTAVVSEVIRAEVLRQELQSTADAAARAAMLAAGRGADAEAAARALITVSGVVERDGRADVRAASSPDPAVEVRLEREVASLVPAWNDGPVRLEAVAAARLRGAPPACVLALADTRNSVSNEGALELDGCGVLSAASHGAAALASMDMFHSAAAASGPCVALGPRVRGAERLDLGGGRARLCGDVAVEAGGTLEVLNGVLVLDGALTIAGGLATREAAIILAAETRASFVAEAESRIDLSAAGAGAFAGIAIGGTATGRSSLEGVGGVAGVVHLPRQTVRLGLANDADCTIVVADRVEVMARPRLSARGCLRLGIQPPRAAVIEMVR